MGLHLEADQSKEVFMKVDKVQLKVHSTHKNIFFNESTHVSWPKS